MKPLAFSSFMSKITASKAATTQPQAKTASKTSAAGNNAATQDVFACTGKAGKASSVISASTASSGVDAAVASQTTTTTGKAAGAYANLAALVGAAAGKAYSLAAAAGASVMGALQGLAKAVGSRLPKQVNKALDTNLPELFMSTFMVATAHLSAAGMTGKTDASDKAAK